MPVVEFEYGGEAFEWDPQKAQLNATLHGISFQEAATAFDDEHQLTVPDERHSDEEDRLFTVARSSRGQLLAIAWTMRQDATRIISARPATRTERRRYHMQQD